MGSQQPRELYLQECPKKQSAKIALGRVLDSVLFTLVALLFQHLWSNLHGITHNACSPNAITAWQPL